MAPPVPLTVIGGFLGAGKTTLVNHILREASGVRFCVLVNDFGALAIDEALIASHDGKTIALANGCICCSLGDDVSETIMDLMEADPAPQHLIIEASGIADPRPVSELGSLDPNLVRDITVVVIDTPQIKRQWGDERLKDTVERQLLAADLFVLNRASDVSDTQRADLKAWLGERNPSASFIASNDGRVALELLTGKPARRASHEAVPRAAHGAHFSSHTLEIAPGTGRVEFIHLIKTLPPRVLRAKGFIMLDGTVHEFQKTGPRTSLKKASCEDPSDLGKIILIGAGTNWINQMPSL